MTRPTLEELHKMTVKELREFATANEINLEGVDRKDHIIERIDLALIGKEGPENDAGSDDQTGEPDEGDATDDNPQSEGTDSAGEQTEQGAPDATSDNPGETGGENGDDTPLDLGISGGGDQETDPAATGDAGATDPEVPKSDVIDGEELSDIGALAVALEALGLKVIVEDVLVCGITVRKEGDNETLQFSKTIPASAAPHVLEDFLKQARSELKV